MQTLNRSGIRIETQRQRIQDIEAKLAAEKERLGYYEAFENAFLHWQVNEQLSGMLSSLIAVGPAFTVCRAISGLTTPDMIKNATEKLPEWEVEEGAADFVRKRSEESETLQEGLSRRLSPAS